MQIYWQFIPGNFDEYICSRNFKGQMHESGNEMNEIEYDIKMIIQYTINNFV